MKVGKPEISLYTSLCVQLPTYADNVALPAFARRTPLSAECRPCSNRSLPAAADLLLWAHAGTDRRIPYIDPAPHTVKGSSNNVDALFVDRRANETPQNTFACTQKLCFNADYVLPRCH